LQFARLREVSAKTRFQNGGQTKEPKIEQTKTTKPTGTIEKIGAGRRDYHELPQKSPAPEGGSATRKNYATGRGNGPKQRTN